MSLDNPYLVFGRITKDGLAVDNAIISVKDLTIGSVILQTTTNASGDYLIDIAEIATNGDLIKVWCFKDGVIDQDTFTLNISGPGEEVNINMTQLEHPYLIFGQTTVGPIPEPDVTIYVQDITLGSEIVTTISDSNGNYLIDISGFCADGDTIKVWCYHYGTNYDYMEFILDISGPGEEINLSLPGKKYTEYPTDALSMSDLFLIGFDKTLSDVMNLIDNISLDYIHLISDSLTISDSLLSSAGYYRQKTDNMSISDKMSYIFLSGLYSYIYEGFLFTDRLTVSLDKPISDSLSYTDTPSWLFSSPVSDAVSITDTKIIAMGKSVTDSISISDDISYIATIMRAYSELMGITDTISSIADYNRGITESFNISDSLAYLLVVNGIYYPNESFSIADAVQTMAVYLRSFNDSLTIADSILLHYNTLFSENLGITDSMVHAATYLRTLSDTMNLYDSLLSQTAYLRATNDTMSISDSMTYVQYMISMNLPYRGYRYNEQTYNMVLKTDKVDEEPYKIKSNNNQDYIIEKRYV